MNLSGWQELIDTYEFTVAILYINHFKMPKIYIYSKISGKHIIITDSMLRNILREFDTVKETT